VLTVFAAAGFAVLIGLGAWQLERRAWKLDLIDSGGGRVTSIVRLAG
jgi:cytochrome oxidase assembly protein ShyY1